MKKKPSISTRYALFDILPVMAGSVVRRYSVPEHFHTSIELWYVFEGALLHKVEDREYVQTPGSLVLVRPYLPHSIDTTISAETPVIFSVSADEASLLRLGYDFFITHSKLAAANGYELPEFLSLNGKQKSSAEKIMRKILAEDTRQDPESPFLRCRLFAELFDILTEGLPKIRISTTIRERTKAISNAVQYISQHFNEKISLDTLASNAFMSKRRFTSNFKSVTGMTVWELIFLFRFYYAEQYLTFSDKSLDEIAKLIGFYDNASFSHSFIENYGMPPSEFRKKHRNPAYSFESKDRLKRERRYKMLNYYYGLAHNGEVLPKSYVSHMPGLL